MNFRALWPWLLSGALLASAFANLSMYRNRYAQAGSLARVVGTDSALIPAFHLAPNASGEHCPTLELLELSAAQRDQIRKCSLSSLDVRTDLAVEIDAAALELEELLSHDDTDGDRVLELADRISGLRSRQYRAWIGSILVVRDVLSPEQLQLLHELESN